MKFIAEWSERIRKIVCHNDGRGSGLRISLQGAYPRMIILAPGRGLSSEDMRQAHQVIADETIAKVDEAIGADGRVRINTVTRKAGIGRGSNDTIVQYRLSYRNVRAKGGTKCLTDEQKNHRMGLCNTPFVIGEEGDALLNGIITGDETWCRLVGSCPDCCPTYLIERAR